MAALLAGCGASTAVRTGPKAARATTPAPAPAVARHRGGAARFPAAVALGLPPVPRGPVPGYLLIADRNNNRLLIISPAGRVVWRFPQSGDVRPGQSFHDPDDAFFTPGYRRLVTNEEFNDSLAQIDLRTKRIVWTYGRAGVAGSGPASCRTPTTRTGSQTV